jgi:hypothetical protein
MSTPAQEAFAEGFEARFEVHGSLWTIGTALLRGIASTLKPDDPRMPASGDRLLDVECLTSELPSPAPARGGELVRAGKFHRIVRVDSDEATGATSILVTA